MISETTHAFRCIDSWRRAIKNVLITGILLFGVCLYAMASDLQPSTPRKMVRHDVSKTEVIMYEPGIPLSAAISCQQHLKKSSQDIWSTQIYKMPVAMNAYLVVAAGPMSDGWYKDWVVVVQEKENVIQDLTQKLLIEGSANPEPHFYVSDRSTLIIEEINDEDGFVYYKVLKYADHNLTRLGNMKIDQYIKGKPLTEMGNLLEEADIKQLGDKYEITLNSLVKKGWAPSLSAVTFRF